MNDPNQFLKDAIGSYLSRVTDYALLVSGPLGSGKTFQVKSALKKSHNNHLYLSAAGASSSDDLSFRLVVAATPFLGSKFANITQQIISGLLARIPFLQKVNANNVARTITLEKPETQGAILRSISTRFSQEPETVTEAERPWIGELIDALKVELEQRKSELLRRRITQMIDWYLKPLLGNAAGSQGGVASGSETTD